MPTVSYGIANTADDVSSSPGAALGVGFPAVGSADMLGIDAYAGFRFLGVAVPQGATITEAKLTLKLDANNGGAYGAPLGLIKGVVAASAPAWTTVRPEAAEKTTQSVPIVGSDNAYVVTAIVQAFVSGAGWASGNNMAFVADPTGASGFVFWIDYQTSAANSAKLSITYTTGGGGPTAKPTFQAFIIG